MRDRIKNQDLELLVSEINERAGFPKGTRLWTPREDARGLRATVGMYYIDSAYGGVNLAKMVTEGGGITCPLGQGMRTKRELYTELRSFLNGLDMAESL